MRFRMLCGVAALALAAGCYSETLDSASSATTGAALSDSVNQVSFSVSGMT